MGVVDSQKEIKDKKEKNDKKKKKSKKESVVKEDITVGSEEERSEKQKKDKNELKKKKEKKKGNTGSADLVTDSKMSLEEEMDEEVRKSKKKKGTSSDNVSEEEAIDEEGGEGKKKKRTSSDDVSDEVIDEEEDKEKKKKIKKKKRSRSDDVSDEAIDTEGGEEKKKKKKKKRTSNDDVSDEVINEEEDKEKRASSDEVSNEAIDEGGEEKKKKKEQMLKSMSDSTVEVAAAAEVDEESGKNKKNRKIKKINKNKVIESERVFDGVGDKSETGEKVEKSAKKEKKRESVGENDDHTKKKQKKKITQERKGEKDSENSMLQTPKKSSKRVSFSDDVEVFDEGVRKKKKPKRRKVTSESGSVQDKRFTPGEGWLVQGKRFTREESEKVIKAVMDYIERHNLGEQGLDMVLNCNKYKELRGCWKEITADVPHRNVSAVYSRAHSLLERGDSRRWTEEEIAYIKDFHKKHGPDWKRMSLELKRHRIHVKDAWRRNKVIENKGRWSQQEYQALFDLVNKDLSMRAHEERYSKHGMIRDNICWSAISEKIETRQIANCCMKWYNQLSSPMVKPGLWADTDDYRLLKALSNVDAPNVDDVEWDDLLDHRDGSLSLNRWNQMVKHIGDYTKLSFSEQVEVLAKRYNPEYLPAREQFDKQPFIDRKPPDVNEPPVYDSDPDLDEHELWR